MHSSIAIRVDETVGTLRIVWTGPADAEMPPMLRDDILHFDADIQLDSGSDERQGTRRIIDVLLRLVGRDATGLDRLNALAQRLRLVGHRLVR